MLSRFLCAGICALSLASAARFLRNPRFTRRPATNAEALARIATGRVKLPHVFPYVQRRAAVGQAIREAVLTKKMRHGLLTRTTASSPMTAR